MSTTPHSAFPPPVDDPEQRAARVASFEDTLDDTIDQSFPASDPPSTNPMPSYASEVTDAGPASGFAWFGDRHMHLRHEGLLWAAAGALGAAASLRLIGGRRSSHLLWQLAPAAVLVGAAITFAREYAANDEQASC